MQACNIMNMRHLLSLLLAATAGFAQDSARSQLTLDLLPNEAWWGGAVIAGPVQKTFDVPRSRLLYFERE